MKKALNKSKCQKQFKYRNKKNAMSNKKTKMK